MAQYYLTSGKFRLTSKFGPRGGRNHNGIDLAAPKGTPIRAFMGGVVIANAYQKNGAGYYVKIRHPDGTVALYMHMNGRSPLKVGQRVTAGQVIGGVGSTGRSTGPHLHFEIRNRNGKAINPLPILQRALNMKVSAGGISSSGFALARPAASSFRGTALKQAPKAIRSYIAAAANRYRIRDELIAAVIKAESNFRQNARSRAGAYGLMQLMPHFGSGRYNPAKNVMLGTQFLAQNLKKYKDVRFALAAYNWGPGNVDKMIKKYGKNWGVIFSKLPKETRTYVSRVLSYL